MHLGIPAEPGQLSLGVAARGLLNLRHRFLHGTAASQSIHKFLVAYSLHGGAFFRNAAYKQISDLLEQPLFQHDFYPLINSGIQIAAMGKIQAQPKGSVARRNGLGSQVVGSNGFTGMLSTASSEGATFGSGNLLEDLVQYVRSGKECRLMLVGDDAQLPPVGLDYSPALDPAELLPYGYVDYNTMDEVVRQTQDSGILFNATMLRCMLENRLYEIPRFDMSYPDFRSVQGGELLEALEECYSKYGRDETIVITRSNKRANRYNEGIRRYNLSAEEEIESGDMLMIVKNNYYCCG